MKNFILGILALTTCHTAFTQSDSSAQLKSYTKIYRQAISYNDLSTSAYAITGMLQNGASSNFNDTLAIVYYQIGNMNGAYKLANELYTQNNKSITAITLLADITGRTSETKQSLEWYEKLVALDNTPYNFYQLATKQFILDRRAECLQSLQQIINDSTKAMQQNTSLDVGNGYSETVPVLAAAYNMQGALSHKNNLPKEAENWYQKAIIAFPDFVIALQNLKTLKEETKPTKPSSGAKTPIKPKQ